MYVYMGKLGETGDTHSIDTFLGQLCAHRWAHPPPLNPTPQPLTLKP